MPNLHAPDDRKTFRKAGGPGAGDVHVDAPLGGKKKPPMQGAAEETGELTPDDEAGELIVKGGDPYQKAVIDNGHGLVFGFAIVSKVAGQDYYDKNIDKATGQPKPDHIPEDAMVESALDFMKNSRAAAEQHNGEINGEIPFAIPLTTEMRDYIVKNDVTGLLIGMAPAPQTLAKFKSGALTGFSIGGSRVIDEEVP